MAMFPNVYVAMVMISTMGIISMSISYCPYALLGQYHEMKEVQTHYCFHVYVFVLVTQASGFIKLRQHKDRTCYF